MLRQIFKHISKLFSLLVLTSLLACTNQSEPALQQSVTAPNKPVNYQRWYTTQQVEQGQALYTQYCQACHLANAKGTQSWKKRLEDGSFPPPPLNGTAHAWHHSLEVLMRVIHQGGIPMGGRMPAFGETLSDDEKRAVIAYFQSFWPDEIYQKWAQMNAR
ncbi:MAG: hypothetical protein CUN55_13030 [Phototrophicales bacterium]|nr:MAG: hypothetical protein CUN55_13030 [Phototrophicales bacterium]